MHTERGRGKGSKNKCTMPYLPDFRGFYQSYLILDQPVVYAHVYAYERTWVST